MRRIDAAAGVSGSSALMRMSRVRLSGSDDALQHQLARPAIVNPHRGAIGAEEALGAKAEDLEPRAQVQRRPEGQRELVEQLAQVTLHLFVLPQPEQLQRRHEGVGDFSGVDTGHVRRSAV